MGVVDQMHSGRRTLTAVTVEADAVGGLDVEPVSDVTPAVYAEVPRGVASAGWPPDGVPASADVVSVAQPTGAVNDDPIVPVELLIVTPGAPPRPLLTTLIVPQESLARLQPGVTLPVSVSPSNPDAVTVNWAG